ncbi:MAG TPA: peptide chain release factor 1 [Candidatus Aminicenantes bacterium]|nr:peptide chain release factor 1 [Candidatus Aminicenantes bacterium]
MATRSNDTLLSCLHNLYEKAQALTQRLAEMDVTSNSENFRNLSRELSRIKPVSDLYLDLRRYDKERSEALEMAKIEDDPEMALLARNEVDGLDEKISELTIMVRRLLVRDAAADHRNVYLEIRAGTGGDEASLFAADLLRMYHRVAERRHWKADVISTTYSSIGGIKEVILHLRGNDVYGQLKFESGVHRVQRVPATESSGRIHTSTATVAVLPEVRDVEVTLNPADVRIDTYRASGSGGQHVNKTESAIRVTHFPSGIVVTCQDESSQHKNRDKALAVLKSRLYEEEMRQQEEGIALDRRAQVGSGERSEKIRTYNFPQNRATDHRISGRNFNLESVLDGNISDLLAALAGRHEERVLQQRFRELSAPCATEN